MDALLYQRLDNDSVRCNLCRHTCLIKKGRRGICGVRENDGGTLRTLVYDALIAQSVDPVEKKPLFHVAPGSTSFSIATVGCNFKCRFCQNADIAQMPADNNGMIAGKSVSPEAIVRQAVHHQCRSISYTYTEPTVYFELAFDTARLAHEKGLKNIFVTNGYMTTEALDMIAPVLDAANVDLKSFSHDFYTSYCHAKRDGVLDTLRHMKSLGIFIEITTLVIPGLNDDAKEIGQLARFIATELGPQTPWHVSRFHPTYRLTDRPATPVGTLSEIRRIGLNEGLHHVYTGNVPGDEGEHTYCGNCGKKIIARWGYRITEYHISDGRCTDCRTPVHGLDM